MDGQKMETAIGMCVVVLTKHIMAEQNIDYEAAYKSLLKSELYKLLQDAETRLFLETNQYLCEAYDMEYRQGIGGLYHYINKDNF